MLYIVSVLVGLVLILMFSNYRLVKSNKSNEEKLEVASFQLREAEFGVWKHLEAKSQQLEAAVYKARGITQEAKVEFRRVREYRNFLDGQKRKKIRKKKGKKSRKRAA